MREPKREEDAAESFFISLRGIGLGIISKFELAKVQKKNETCKFFFHASSFLFHFRIEGAYLFFL